MKKLLFLFLLAIAICVGCEKETGPVPDCEIQNTGTLKIVNKTGVGISVSFTYTLNEEPVWDYLPYGYWIYEDVSAGTVYIWVMRDGSDYKKYEKITLRTCSYQPFNWN